MNFRIPFALRSRAWVAVVLAVTVLAGCASDPARMSLGASEAQVVERLGPPTGRYALSDGVRLQYSLQPRGFFVSNIDLDAQGRVRSVTQVLDEARFAQDIQVNQWRRDDVLRYYGPPSETSEVYSFKGVVWTWRYLWLNTPRQLHIFIDPQGVVRQYQTLDELRLDPDL